MNERERSGPVRSGLERLYPEIRAGGFARNDHRLVFYARVRALLGASDVVLDFGAGRGKFAQVGTDAERDLVSLRSRCARVIGCDLDPVVASNPLVDEAVVIGADGRIPLEDESVDMVVSWATFEHVADPEGATREIDRVLRPGGWLCAWTPNRWGYVGVGARLVPRRWHRSTLRALGDPRPDEDIFDTAYRLNTRAAFARAFPPPRYEHFTYGFNGPPTYLARSQLAARAFDRLAALAPEGMSGFWHVFVRKSE